MFPRSHRRKLSLAHKDKPGSKKGKKLTKQQRKRLSEAIKKYWAVNREEYLESIRRGKARGAVERAKRSWDNYRKRKQLKEECSTPLIVPITFRKEHKQMLQMLMKAISDGLLKVHPQFEDIFVALKSAQNKGDDPVLRQR
ncbi:MAG: hypothetical protein WBL68_18610 [Nitrososphaeraceae archaeon]